MNNGDLNEEFGDVIHNTILEVQMSVGESGELFIFRTIKPFCEEVLSREISKKELKEMLLKAERMKWIPCSERLPKGTVLCCDDRGNMLVGLLCKDEAGYIAYGDDGQEMYNCVAWMQLREPYREEERL